MIKYRGACYKKNKIVEVGFASQKNFIGLYILKQDVMEKYRGQQKGKGVSIGKGCIHYTKPGKINFEVVNKILKEIFIPASPSC